MKKQFIIIGAGPGGYVAAIRAAQLGAIVTLIEGRDIGWNLFEQRVYFHKSHVYQCEKN